MSAEPPPPLRICVTVPFFADLRYLEAALQSLVAQTDPHWTAIVVDDASPEHGAARVVAAIGDARIRYTRNESNLGISANFNRCLELGGGGGADVVAVFHADDELEPDYVAAVRRAHDTFPLAACVAPRATVIDHRGARKRTITDAVKRMLWPRRLPAVIVGERGLARLMHGLFFYCPAVSYRVELLGGLRFDQRWRQVMDLDFFARLVLHGGTIALVSDRVYRYRRHAGTVTAQNSQSLLRLEEEVAVCREVGTAARDAGWRRAARAARLRVSVRLHALVEAAHCVTGGRLRVAVGAVRYAISR